MESTKEDYITKLLMIDSIKVIMVGFFSSKSTK